MIADKDPLPQLLKTLQSNRYPHRLQAARALGRLGPLAIDALPHLEAALGDEADVVREAVSQAIGLMGPGAVPALARAVTHSDKRVRRQAVWALGRLGPAAVGAVPGLCTALRDPDPRTAAGAAQALGSIGRAAEAAVPALGAAMRDPNMVVCRLAAQALSRVGRASLPSLLEALVCTDSYVRREAALALGWMGPLAGEAVHHLVDLVRDAGDIDAAPADGETADAPRATVATIVVPRKNADQIYRVHAAQALARIGRADPAVIDALTAALNDAYHPLREAAAQALNQLLAKG
jgi:HEAT repeat protein